MKQFLILLAFFLTPIGLVNAQAPIEAYGELPDIRAMSLSPDGSRIAYLGHIEGTGVITVYDFEDGPVLVLGTDRFKARDVQFATENFILLRASETTRIAGYRGDMEYTGAFSINLAKEDVVQLFRNTEELYPAQSGLGRIVGRVSGEDKVFMPAFTGLDDNPPYDLFKVDLDNGRGRRYIRGRSYTIDWVVAPDGTVLAREDYSNRQNEYKIWTRRNDSWELLYEQEAEAPPFEIVGVKSDYSGLLLFDESAAGYTAVYEMGFDGVLSNEIFARSGTSVENVLVDQNRVVYGVRFAGMQPTYEFYDSSLTNEVKAVQQLFPSSSVFVSGWSDDFQALLFFVTGGRSSGEYHLYDRAKKEIKKIADGRSAITPELVAPADVIEYKARDDLTIPSILTWPLGIDESDRRNLPLIVMPHGGPEAYDIVSFDWMAQFFASRGYLVLQPNFRGSAGFGRDFLVAGRGEWGGKMQDDVTDGVNALIRAGYADPDRVCIVGASYGGYSALIGGAFTPDLYACIAAIAPVSDLPRMILEEERNYGRDHWVVSYWQSLIGDRQDDREKLANISPVNHARSYIAPVLLIHGRDDTVVPIDQSRLMERALRHEGKDVELIELKDEDHYLSLSETRLETLRALDAFILNHLGPG